MSRVHDRYFKLALSDPNLAKSLVESHLPRNVLEILDIKTVELEKDSFVEKDGEYFADLLFSVNLKKGPKAFVYILYEHKSYKDGNILLQLLQYMLSIWKQCIKQNKKARLPRIIPVVVYHGKSAWKIPDKFSKMFEDEKELDSYLPDFCTQVFNTRITQEIEGPDILKLFIWSLRHAFDRNLIQKLVEIDDIFLLVLNNPDKFFQADANMTYWAEILKISEEVMVEKIKAVLNLGGVDMELISERFRKKGKQEGRKEKEDEILKMMDQVSSLEELKKCLKSKQ